MAGKVSEREHGDAEAEVQGESTPRLWRLTAPSTSASVASVSAGAWPVEITLNEARGRQQQL